MDTLLIYTTIYITLC